MSESVKYHQRERERRREKKEEKNGRWKNEFTFPMKNTGTSTSLMT